jgi:hypothetical protein
MDKGPVKRRTRSGSNTEERRIQYIQYIQYSKAVPHPISPRSIAVRGKVGCGNITLKKIGSA